MWFLIIFFPRGSALSAGPYGLFSVYICENTENWKKIILTLIYFLKQQIGC